MRRCLRLGGGGLIALTLVLVMAACAGPATPTPAPTPASVATPRLTPTPTPTPALSTPVAPGQQLFTTHCAGCHGAEGRGTDIAPAVSGHSESVVRRQVRTPMGRMPPFPIAAIKDQELNLITSFIASLPIPEEHTEPAATVETLAVHHWMALVSLHENDTEDALHHIGHILEMVTDARHRFRMIEAREFILQDKLHDAEHDIGEMLSGEADPHLPLAKLHLRLALSDVELKNAQDAIHHMEHFISVAGETAAQQAREVLEQLREGELHEAEHEIKELLETPLVEATPEPTPTPPPTPAATPTPPPHMYPAQITYDPTWPEWYLVKSKRTYKNNCAACHDMPTVQRIQAFPSDEAMVEFIIGMAEGAHASEEDTAHIVRYLLALRHSTAP